jgi:hypothetical protein
MNFKAPQISAGMITPAFSTALLCLLMSGCGEAAKPWEKVTAVSGTLTFEGKPIGGAEVTLIPTASDFPETVRPSGTTSADGSFTLGTYGTADGAPAGEYNASVVWFKVVDSGGSMVRGANVLPARYANPETSGIKVVVNASESTLAAIDLKKK